MKTIKFFLFLFFATPLFSMNREPTEKKLDFHPAVFLEQQNIELRINKNTTRKLLSLETLQPIPYTLNLLKYMTTFSFNIESETGEMDADIESALESENNLQAINSLGLSITTQEVIMAALLTYKHPNDAALLIRLPKKELSISLLKKLLLPPEPIDFFTHTFSCAEPIKKLGLKLLENDELRVTLTSGNQPRKKEYYRWPKDQDVINEPEKTKEYCLEKKNYSKNLN